MEPQKQSPIQTMQQLRAKVLTTPPPPNRRGVYGVVVDMGMRGGLATLVAVLDAVSLYLSNGGGIIGLGTHVEPRAAAERLKTVAEQNLDLFVVETAPFLPEEGQIRFHVLTDEGRFAAEAGSEEIKQREHPLFIVFRVFNELMTAVRTSEAGRQMTTSGRK